MNNVKKPGHRKNSLSTSSLAARRKLVEEFPCQLPRISQLLKGPILENSTNIADLTMKVIEEPEMSIVLTEDLCRANSLAEDSFSEDDDVENAKENKMGILKIRENINTQGPLNLIKKKPTIEERNAEFNLNIPHQGRSRISIVLERSLTMSNEVISNFNVIEKIDGVTMMDILRRKVILTFPKGRKTEKTLLLDMDETLIHTLNPMIHYPKCIEMSKIHSLTFNDPVTCTHEKIDIVIRPYAIELLQQMHPLCEIIIFTAGVKSYADCILNFLDVNHDLIDHRLYRDRCVRRENYHVKDLRIFQNRKLENLIIVDNSIVSFASQLDNGIHVSSFVGNKKDKELNELIPILENLIEKKDVRRELTSTFCMPELFKLHTNAELDFDISDMITPESRKREENQRNRSPKKSSLHLQ